VLPCARGIGKFSGNRNAASGLTALEVKLLLPLLLALLRSGYSWGSCKPD
jgi:hypothetical protein